MRGRIAANVARIAGIMSLVEGEQIIDYDVMGKAIMQGQYFVDQALEISEAHAVNAQLRNCELLLGWIKGNWPENYVSITTLKRYGPNSMRKLDDETYSELLTILAEHGYLLKVYGKEVEIKKNKSTTAWAVHPKMGKIVAQ